MPSIWIGWDPREADAYAVARSSIRRHLTQPIPVMGLRLNKLIEQGLYKRPHERRTTGNQIDGFETRTYDVISDAPISTQHANARFLVPHLQGSGYALFVDGDILCRANLVRLFEHCMADPSKAVWVVKHNHEPNRATKMDGQAQTKYARKNWSSVCVWNCQHEATKALTLEMVNTLPGRDLHRFCWMPDDVIGELDARWNYLVGHTKTNSEPKLIHFTDGTPAMRGYENCEYADEWRAELTRWAA